LFLAINALGLPLAVVVNTPSSIWGWLGALFWEMCFVVGFFGLWRQRHW
jgi:hypothetical protein